MSKERIIGIDLLKLIAALLVMNSHFDTMYGNYSFLATGGTIGDILFFFCSGYTLFLKPFRTTLGGAISSFPDWYKRRINRIWPSLIAVAIVKCAIIGISLSFVQGIYYHGYWFIDSIMIFYIVLYLIGSFWRWNYKWIYIIVSLATFIWFFLMDKPSGYSMYEPNSYIRWLPYFLFMLMGAQLGKSRNNQPESEIKGSGMKNILLFFAYAAMYYFFLGFSLRIPGLCWIQPFSFLPLLPCIYHLYKFSCSPVVECYIKRWYSIIATIGGLCLEIYLVADFYITDLYNRYFPVNIIVVIALTIVSAYLLRCLARLLAQTFKESPYNYKEIVKLY